jgi:hypothetical protein
MVVLMVIAVVGCVNVTAVVVVVDSYTSICFVR